MSPSRRTTATAPSSGSLLEICHAQSIALLRRNLTRSGVLAATATERAARRGYTAIFGRDAAVCAIGLALSGDPELERLAPAGLRTLARHQAPNGQIPKFVDVHSREADFWYLGCIDATLWWLIALAVVDRSNRGRKVPGREATRSSRRRGANRQAVELTGQYGREVGLALRWLLAQEHQRFFLLQQNEASDWADIMPRSGFVLYTNALWYCVKRLYGLSHAAQTRRNFNSLFHPFSAGIAEYRRARLLSDYVLRRARNRDLYLSFVNFAFFGEEGDVFGNILAILLGLTDAAARRRTLAGLLKARVHEPYPVRAVTRPIGRNSKLWRPYMARHRQNLLWQYHNGGIWPMVGGFWVCALVAAGHSRLARTELLKLAQVCGLRDWRFSEWLHGRTFALRGMPGQSWNAAAYLIAEHAVVTGRVVFGS